VTTHIQSTIGWTPELDINRAIDDVAAYTREFVLPQEIVAIG